MNAAQVHPGPVEFGIWMPVSNAARFYGVPPRTIRQWLEDGRLRSIPRQPLDGVKGVLVWSEEVATLTELQRARGGRLPRSDAPKDSKIAS